MGQHALSLPVLATFFCTARTDAVTLGGFLEWGEPHFCFAQPQLRALPTQLSSARLEVAQDPMKDYRIIRMRNLSNASSSLALKSDCFLETIRLDMGEKSVE